MNRFTQVQFLPTGLTSTKENVANLLLYEMRLTENEIENIKELYMDGRTYNELSEITKRSNGTLRKILKGIRSRSDSRKLSISKGRANLRKCWTKPERIFKDILNELGIGVKFPDFIKEIYNLLDDPNPEINFQYPLQRYICDFVDCQRKIIYQVNGDYWHANPLLYDHSKLTKQQKNNLTHDKNRIIFLNANGYMVCVIWESEIKWNRELVKEKVKATRKMVIRLGYNEENTAFDSLVAYSDDEWSNKVKELWFKNKSRQKKPRIEKTCMTCGKSFFLSRKRRKCAKYCSSPCAKVASRKVARPTKDELSVLLWESPSTILAKKFGVSDRMIGKWAKYYNIPKPGRGFWTKLNK